MTSKKIVFANDYRGVELKKELLQYAKNKGLDVEDIGIEEGSSLDFVDISRKLAKHLHGTDNFGILICGSGQGVSIAVNRYSDMRAAMCRTPEDAVSVRQKLNANVMCLGSKTSTLEELISCFNTFISTDFGGEKYKECALKLNASATEHASNGVNLIVRSIITHENHVLLTTVTKENKEFSSDLYFLPGGHVDYTEPAVDALRRELKEEMNVEAGDIEFKGALECSWPRKGEIYHEINLVYKVDLPNLDLSCPPKATESFHQFNWVPVEKVSELSILPKQLKPLILESVKSDGVPGFYSEMMER